MSFSQIIQNFLDDTLGASGQTAALWAFAPELIVCVTIVAILLARMILPQLKGGAFYVTLIGTGVALLTAIPGGLFGGDTPTQPESIFTGLLVFDGFSIYMRCLLLLFVILFTAFTQISGVPDRDDATEFYVLVLGATLGMCLMVAANHMLIVFLGIEMASIPSYVLVGLLRHRRRSSEAALKYAVFGAGAAGVMLYGISLLAGVLGSAHLPTMAARLAEMLDTGTLGDQSMVLVLGGLMLMVGLAFKLSAVPFHFWAPDVFEGATAEVGAFLSIASKAAALALLLRLAIGLGYVDTKLETAYAHRALVAAVAERVPPNSAHEVPVRNVEFLNQQERADEEPAKRPLLAALSPVRKYIVGLIGLIAAITCTFGNLAAYGQTNMKRLLAYSTIAHAGYMMMPVAAAVALIGHDPAAAQNAVASLAAYVAVYLFMNLGAFAAVAFLRNAIGSETIADYAGLIRKSPGLAVCFSAVLFSLLGLPPLAGFTAKFAAFASLADAGLILLLVVGALNTVLSLFYYLRVVRVMVLAPEPEGRPAPQIPLSSIPGAFCAALTLALIVLFVLWGSMFELAQAAFVVF